MDKYKGYSKTIECFGCGKVRPANSICQYCGQSGDLFDFNEEIDYVEEFRNNNMCSGSIRYPVCRIEDDYISYKKPIEEARGRKRPSWFSKNRI